jgi:hypothetical protein
VLDKKIQADCDTLELIKDIHTMHQLSAADHCTYEEKHASLICFRDAIFLKADSFTDALNRSQKDKS